MRALAWCHRWLAAGLLGAAAVLAATPAAALTQPASHISEAYAERLVAEFAPWVGGPGETEALVNALGSGQAVASSGAASVAPVTGPLGYGEARLALKLAQGALAQEGITQPTSAQIQAALHGGTLDAANGPKQLPGVLPQRAQGVGWGVMAHSAGMSVEDLMPPKSVAPKKAPATKASKAKKKSGKASASKRSSKPAAKAVGKKTAKAAAAPRKAAAKKPSK